MNQVSYLIYSIVCAICLSACVAPEKQMERKSSFDEGWSFHYGDISDTAVFHPVDIPHDWSVEMPFVKSEGGIAIGQTQGGTGLYRKTFRISDADATKRKVLYFEGVYMESEVWVNGKQISYHPYGYTSFFCDITDDCKPSGQENVVEVKVKNEGKNSRWYAGSGIYRHVWLITTEQLHLNEWGVFVSTELPAENQAKINLAIEVSNESDKSEDCFLNIVIKNAKGNIVGEKESTFLLKGSRSDTVRQSIQINNPEMWSVEHPVLYVAELQLKSDHKIKDILTVPFGIRTIDFSAKEGFLLNGIPMKLKGGCVHHDNGLLGAAAIDRAEEKKVELLKSNGFNAVRCSHNPPSEKFLEACDRLGLLVIDEAFDQWQKPKNPQDYHRFFDEWSERDLASMVLRDRNHPSVIMWSIGNEIQERADSSGVAIAHRLKGIVRKYDTTRPVTAAVNDFWDNPGLKWEASASAFSPLDVCGYNYMWWEYENDTKRYPERVIYGSETTAMERAINWDLVEKHPNIIGDFIWTAIDYLGESGIGHAVCIKKGDKNPPQFLDWPWFNAWCGDIDICGYKKPQTALRDVLWNTSKITMLVHAPVDKGNEEKVSYWGWSEEESSWNWKGHEGKEIAIKVYTRYPSVRLYLNGILVEEKNTAKESIHKYSVQFKVKYESGELKAVGMESGKEQESVTLATTGNAAKVRLRADRLNLKDTKNDLVYVQMELVDEKGYIVPDEDCNLELSITGNGKILATGNACPTDMSSFRSLTPMTYKGKALAILQPTGGEGSMTLKVSTQKSGEQTIIVNVQGK